MEYGKIDKFLIKVLWWHFGIFTLIAFAASVLKVAEKFPSPFAWRVISPVEASVSVMLALAATAIPIILVGKLKNHYAFRAVITTCFVVYSYLFVFISGGSIEMHFHFFMVVSLLIVYADWRLEWILLVLTALHHGILNYVQPGWVYFYGRNDFAVISHALPVLGAVIFTTVLCQTHRSAILALENAKTGLEATITQRTKELQEANSDLDKKVQDRTQELEKRRKELEDRTKELEKANDLMVGRELKMAEMKEKLKTQDGTKGSETT